MFRRRTHSGVVTHAVGGATADEKRELDSIRLAAPGMRRTRESERAIKHAMAEHSLQSIRDYRRLSNRLATAGQPSEVQLVAVADAGFGVVINLALSETSYSLPDERGTVEALGLAYEHIPVIWEEPILADFERFVQTMSRHADKRVFVHCAANMRVSVFVALYRITQLDWPVERAMAAVHDIWQPNETWQRFIKQVLARF